MRSSRPLNAKIIVHSISSSERRRNEQTLEKLKAMRLSGMADLYEQQAMDETSQSLGFEERFELLVDAESARRKSNKLERLILKRLHSWGYLFRRKQYNYQLKHLQIFYLWN